MGISHTKEFGVYHWDTFDNETLLVGEADTEEEAATLVNDKYGDRVSLHGADRVDIVDSKGNVIDHYSIR